MLLFDLIDALERRQSTGGLDPALPPVGDLPPATPPFSTPPFVPWPQQPQPPVFRPVAQRTFPASQLPAGLIDLLLRDTADETPAQGPAIAPPAPPSLPEYPAWWRTGEEVRAMPEGQKIRDIADTVQDRLPPLTLARASLAPDLATQIKRLSEATGIPERSFGVIDGRIVYGDSTGQIHYAVPTVARADRSQGFRNYVDELVRRSSHYLASKAGPAVPSVAGGAAGGALMEFPLLSVPAAGATAFTADLARQWLDKALAGEPLMTTDYDWDSAGSSVPPAMGGQWLGLGTNTVSQIAPAIPSIVGSNAIRGARSSVNRSFDREREERRRAEYERGASAGAKR